jgi:hypothetical protein
VLLRRQSRVHQVLELRLQQEDLSQVRFGGVSEPLLVFKRVLVLRLPVSAIFLQLLQLGSEGIFLLCQILQLLGDVGCEV